MKFKSHIRFSVLALLAWFWPLIAEAQLSPGDLCEPHAHLEGLSKCTLCHTLGNKVSDQKCLDCHQALDRRIKASKGYHASSAVMGKSCVSCHNDHHGRNFQIIRFDEEKFDHRLAGYPLEGAHQKAACRDCHQKKFIADSEIAAQKYTFLGLDTQCLSCHEDHHQQSLPENCLQCHDYQAFKPATAFNHDDTKFVLLGKHRETDCKGCHKVSLRNGKEFQQFNGLKFNNCVDCHEDVHNNKFGQDCRQCHSEKSFRQLNSRNAFDHKLTGYPLEGRHQLVACAACHKNSYSQALKHGSCTDCHADYHEGQLMKAGKPAECSDCHTVNGFAGSSYTIEQHQQSAFELRGAHQATPCFECHLRKEKWQFKQLGQKCDDCHADVHEGYIPQTYYANDGCTTCHSEEQWNSIVFDHNRTSYPLEGAHRLPSCRACHIPGSKAGVENQRFEGLNRHCNQCHDDNHQRQFDRDGATDCLRCHDFDNWKASAFDHAKTNFPLEGKHALAACTDCHKTVPVAQKSYVLYKINDFRCETCH